MTATRTREADMKTATETQLETELKAAGAVQEKREDRHGETRTGWWLDGVWLGKTVKEALNAIRGN